MGLTNVMNRICLNGRAVASSMHFFVLPKMFLIFLFKDFLSYVPAPEQRDEIRKSDVNVSESGVAVPKQLIVVVTRFGRPLVKEGVRSLVFRVRSQAAGPDKDSDSESGAWAAAKFWNIFVPVYPPCEQTAQ